jgi:flagellar biosynthesis protein FlhA
VLLTVFGLVIQICFTRLILTKGEAFDGRIIRAISSLMAFPGGIKGLITGSLIFLILTMIMAIVVIRGVTRIAARFALDSLPGRQMAIDAEYSSGAITGEEAIVRKAVLQRESDFYGALDGASHFISGYFKFSLIITAVSIIAGIAICTLVNGDTIYIAMMTYIPLSISNSLLTQFLGLIESIIVGIIVTRTAPPHEPYEEPAPDLIRIELGLGLIPLVDRERANELLERLQGLRHQLAEEIKIAIPKIRIIDNITLESKEYRILIKEAEVGRGIIHPDCLLCIGSGEAAGELPGEKTCDPVSGLPAFWVSVDKREEAERLGYTVVDPVSIIPAHLTELIKRHIAEFQAPEQAQ